MNRLNRRIDWSDEGDASSDGSVFGSWNDECEVAADTTSAIRIDGSGISIVDLVCLGECGR